MRHAIHLHKDAFFAPFCISAQFDIMPKEIPFADSNGYNIENKHFGVQTSIINFSCLTNFRCHFRVLWIATTAYM